jgi:hypothetical protein
VKFPIGGKAHEPVQAWQAGSGGIPGPTVKVWMEEGLVDRHGCGLTCFNAPETFRFRDFV